MEPKVTGLSPMEGPPGTKIKIRGENLGQSKDDIIKLVINGADCWPYLEWESSKKIIARCTNTIGSGDVIVTTNTGGTGTCDVKFNCYQEIIGPNDESAVWVDDTIYQTPDKKISEISDDEYSSEISSKKYPQSYLLRNHQNANLNDLQQLQKSLQAKLSVNNHSDQVALLKADLPVIMECLQVLERLSKVRDFSIDNIVGSIREGLEKTHKLFNPLLTQNNLVQSIESAMQVFKQNETLINLPSAIENCIEAKNYDSVVEEISVVKSRLKNIDIDAELKDKIEKNVAKRVSQLRSAIERQLLESCRNMNGKRNIDDMKKLICHLNRLGELNNFDVWIVIKEMSISLDRNMLGEFKNSIELSIQESKELNGLNFTSADASIRENEPPHVVRFVQSAMNMFHSTYYYILSLGQSYFDPKDEFACQEDIRQQRLTEFNEAIVLKPVEHLCFLLRLALVPNSPGLENLDRSHLWPKYETQKEAYSSWLRHVLHKDWLRHILQSVISCHVHLTKVNVPSIANILVDFKVLVFELRRRFMRILFENATLLNKNLHHKEDWVAEVDDRFGKVTKLPLIFEKNVSETLKFANETLFKTSQPGEKSILEDVPVQGEMKELVQSLINSFLTSLDNAAVTVTSESTPLTDRYLITICNYQFTKDRILQNLKDEFTKLFKLDIKRVYMQCTEKYCDYIKKAKEKYSEIKYQELVSEYSEYPKRPKDKQHATNSDLQISLMIANAQIFQIAPQLVDDLMPEIVNRMHSEESPVQRL